MLVVSTQKNPDAMAEPDNVLVTLKDPMSGTYCAAQPGPYGYLKDGAQAVVKQLKSTDDPTKVSAYVIVDDEDEAHSTQAPSDTVMTDGSGSDEDWMRDNGPSLLVSCSVAAERFFRDEMGSEGEAAGWVLSGTKWVRFARRSGTRRRRWRTRASVSTSRRRATMPPAS